MALRDLLAKPVVGPQDCADAAETGDYKTWLATFKDAAETGQPFPVVQLGRRYVAAPEAVLRAFGIDPGNDSTPANDEGRDSASIVAFPGAESGVADG